MVSRRISKLLIANRGEIAVRIMRTCREMGIRTVAVYSDADRTALHVRHADEAYLIGLAPARESYLNIENVLEAARQSGADAIHPGYGFLSENADFALACEKAGVTFIGPPADTIRAMGDKTRARRLMQAAGVPVVPGTDEAIGNFEEAAILANEIGYPVIVKAAAGGGGKGMRRVDRPDGLRRALTLSQGEAQSAFGDRRLFIEKYIRQPRHVEIQVLFDAHANGVHLFERECSVQRRHQKVIEEAPSSVLKPDVRAHMGEIALRAAAACAYRSAGTVEFLVDEDLRFYFMEMNTRLQVEHPVTEMITGVDLVAEQIRVAEGRKLSVSQAELSISGHAVECRIYAEDPAHGFLPDAGRLLRHRAPSGPCIRVDGGVEEWDEVPLHYDPMISKVSAWGSTRDAAIACMLRALSEYTIAGVKTTIPFCRFVLESAPFRSGQYSTHFVSDHFHPDDLGRLDPDVRRAAAIAAALHSVSARTSRIAPSGSRTSPWLQRKEL